MYRTDTWMYVIAYVHFIILSFSMAFIYSYTRARCKPYLILDLEPSYLLHYSKSQIIALYFLFMLCLKFFISTVDCLPCYWPHSYFLTFPLLYAKCSFFFSFHFFSFLFSSSLFFFSFLYLSYLFFSSTVFQTLAGNRKSVYKHMLTKKHIGQCADVKSGKILWPS